MEEEEEHLAWKVYAAILAGGRGGTYGEEDLRRYARYSLEAARVWYEEFFGTDRGGVLADQREGEKEKGGEGGMDGRVQKRVKGGVGGV